MLFISNACISSRNCFIGFLSFICMCGCERDVNKCIININVISETELVVNESKFDIADFSDKFTMPITSKSEAQISAGEEVKHKTIRHILDVLSSKGVLFYQLTNGNDCYSIEFGTVYDCSYSKRKLFPAEVVSIIINDSGFCCIGDRSVKCSDINKEFVLEEMKLNEDYTLQVACGLHSLHSDLISVLKTCEGICRLKGVFVVSYANPDKRN